MALTKPVNVVSRFQDVIRCNVCNEEVGQLHCDTCQVYICTSCTGTHVTSDLSKQHVVVECKKRSKIKLTECKTHVSQRCELYCKQCHVPVCSKCMASTHANHSVIDIQEFCKTKQEEIRKENEKIEISKISVLEKAKLELKTQIENLPKQLDEIKIQVAKHGEVWHSQIEAIIKQFTSELEEMKKTYLDRMRDHQQKLDDHILLCRQILDDNTDVLHSSVLSSFNEYKSRIQEIQDIPFRVDVKLPKFHRAIFEIRKNQFGSLQAGSLQLMSVVDKQSRPEEPVMVTESPMTVPDQSKLNFIGVPSGLQLENKHERVGFPLLHKDASESEVGGECYKCGKPGHTAREFESTQSLRPLQCYNCDEEGHISRECPNKLGGDRGNRNVKCYECSEYGHLARDCPNKPPRKRGGGGGVECYNCGKMGHISRECQEERSGRVELVQCYSCLNYGHFARDCPNGDD